MAEVQQLGSGAATDALDAEMEVPLIDDHTTGGAAGAQCLCTSYHWLHFARAKSHQDTQEPVALCAASGAFGADMEFPFIDDDDVHLPGATVSQRQPDEQPKEGVFVPTEMDWATAAFTRGLQSYFRTFLKEDLDAQTPIAVRGVLMMWNSFLQWKRGGEVTRPIVSPDILNDAKVFTTAFPNMDNRGITWMHDRLSWWNSFLVTRQGQSPVSKFGAILTGIGLLFYVLNMGSDMYTAAQFGYQGQWWRSAVTLLIMYAAVAISTVYKWLIDGKNSVGSVDMRRYFGSLLVNWPDLQRYWTLLRVEWKLAFAPTRNAHLIRHWQVYRLRVAWLKYAEGVCEACPQALLQLVLLLPDLNGDISWTVSTRLVATAISFCSAGAAPVNFDKFERFTSYSTLPLGELAVLHLWVVPVTVSRLLCLALLLSVHLLGGLACMALHCALYYLYWCYTRGRPPTQYSVFALFLLSVQFLLSPFVVSDPRTARPASVPRPSYPVRHALHFFTNAVVTVLWALHTPLFCTQPALCVSIIVTIGVLFVIGLLGWLLHRRFWQM